MAQYGLTKSGSFSTTNSYTPITGWTADAGSILTSNALGLTRNTVNAVIDTSLGWTASASRTLTARLKVNGTIVKTGTASASGTSGTTVCTSDPINMLVTDTATVESTSNLGSSTPSVSSGFLRIYYLVNGLYQPVAMWRATLF